MSDPNPAASADFFVLRTPALPLDFQSAWGQDLAGTEADRESLRQHLRAAVGRPQIREALFLASSHLEASLDPWLDGRLSEARARRLELGLLRYLTRMSSRSTPFGLFAGIALGSWGERSRLEVPAWDRCRRHTRLDQDYLELLTRALEEDPDLRGGQTYRPNTSLYRVGGSWRYAETRLQPGHGRDHHLVALEASPHLDATLARAAGGATLAALAGALVQEFAADFEEAEAFLAELIGSQVLVGDLAPALTGGDGLTCLAERLQAGPGTGGLGLRLCQVRAGLEALDQPGATHDRTPYQALARDLASLPATPDPLRLFQVDLRKPTPELSLDARVRRAVETAVALLARLSPAPAPGQLDTFKQAFRDRYDTRWVPLLEALDGEAGVGFGPPLPPGLGGQPLLSGLPFPEREGPQERVFSARDRFLLNRLQALGGAPVWRLDAADLAALSTPAHPLPDAFAAVATLAGPGPEALARGEFQLLLESCSGPSGARLLGRFCAGYPELEAQVRGHLAAEEALRPEAIFAEVVHLPDGRTGNILARPTLRRFEIPFLGVSGVPEERQIPPADLLVAVLGDRVRLRSRRLGREVLPRLSSAHNTNLGLPVYRFLGAVQEQDGGSFGWSWGCLGEAGFLPRVVHGRHVLARARWRVTREECPEPADFAAVQRLRSQRGLPRMVVLEDGDNALWVDLDHPLRVDALLHLIAGRPWFTLREAFPGPGELVAAGPEGQFRHELIVPFLRPGAIAPGAAPAPLQADLRRSCPPGSDWLYLKLYTGEASADRVLTEILGPILASARDRYLNWFFLRFRDPAAHLRLRFQGDPQRLHGELLPLLYQALAPALDSGLIWKLQLDTYERELERYGGQAGIPLAERWFSLDSQRTLELLGSEPLESSGENRWRWGLKGLLELFDDFGLDLAARARVVAGTRTTLGLEFQAQGQLSRVMGERFRSLRPELEELRRGHWADPADAIWRRHRQAQRACLLALREEAQAGRLGQSLEQLASSYAHMAVNRLARSDQRAQEFTLMDFLARMDAAALARQGIRPEQAK